MGDWVIVASGKSHLDSHGGAIAVWLFWIFVRVASVAGENVIAIGLLHGMGVE